MRPAPALFTLGLLSASAMGCAPFGSLDGEWTGGEQGRTRWQTLDGLCPGIGGGCDFDVPIAVGAQVTLPVDGIDGAAVTAAFTGGVEGAGAIEVESEHDTRVPIRVIAEGPGRTELSDANGALDAATIFGRTVTRLECGRWPRSQGIDWRMSGLEVSDDITLPLTSFEEESPPFTLACRASDREGPILSADAIEWTVLSGSELLEIGSTGLLVFPGSSARGARIEAFTGASGQAVVRAQIGNVSRDLTITIE